MPGTLGTSTNSPIISAGTLSLGASPLPGPATGRRDLAGAAAAVPSEKINWESINKAREWEQRIAEWAGRLENYRDPRKREAQIVKDSVELPLKFLEAAGIELNTVPLLKMWLAEVDFLGKCLEAVDNAQAQIEQSKRQWNDAVRIAKEIGPRAADIVSKTHRPETEPYIWQYDSIVKWYRGHEPAAGIGSGIFMGQGYGLFRVSSELELRQIVYDCRARIYRKAVKLLWLNLTLRIQQTQVRELALAREQTLDKMMDTGNSFEKIAAARESTSAALERDAARPIGGGESAESDPGAAISAEIAQLQDIAQIWGRAAISANRWGLILG
jgi:hypothetical protein